MKILMRRRAALGDVILSTPIARKLHKDAGPKSTLTVETDYPGVFQNNPHVSEVLAFGNATEANYDRTVDLDMAYEMKPNMHVIDAYGQNAFGHTDFDKRVELFPDLKASLRIDAFLRPIASKYLVIHMRKHHWVNRNFSEDFWKEVVLGVLAQTSMKIVQVGAPYEIAFDGSDRLINGLGMFNIHETYELIRKSSVFVGVDAGALHIASCTKTPIVSLFTAAHHEFRKPMREENNFFPLFPKQEFGEPLSCYGCQATEPAPYSDGHCRRGDVICTKLIKPADLIEKMILAINK